MRIAHVTDPHLRHNLPGTSVLAKRRSRDGTKLLTLAIDDARKRGAEMLVVTGDLVDVPPYLLDSGPSEVFDKKRRYDAMNADYRMIRDLLLEAHTPFIALPGNHDFYELAERYFGAQPRVHVAGGLSFFSFWDREGEGHVPRRVGPERRLFNQAVNDETGPIQVHLQHFVVTPELNHDWPHTYGDGEELRKSIVASGRVCLVLSGHYHPGVDLIRDGAVTFSVGSALAERPHCYRLYDVDGLTGGASPRVAMQVIPLLGDRPPHAAAFVDLAACLNTLSTSWEALPQLRLQRGLDAALEALAERYQLVFLVDQAWADQARASSCLLDGVFDRSAELLSLHGATLDAIYITRDIGKLACASTLNRACTELGLDLARSVLLHAEGQSVEEGKVSLHTHLDWHTEPELGEVQTFDGWSQVVMHVLRTSASRH